MVGGLLERGRDSRLRCLPLGESFSSRRQKERLPQWEPGALMDGDGRRPVDWYAQPVGGTG